MKKLSLFTLLLIAFCTLSFTTLQEGKIQKIGDNLYSIPSGTNFSQDDRILIEQIIGKYYDLGDLKSKTISSIRTDYLKGGSGPNAITLDVISPTIVTTRTISIYRNEYLQNQNLLDLKKILEKYAK